MGGMIPRSLARFTAEPLISQVPLDAPRPFRALGRGAEHDSGGSIPPREQSSLLAHLHQKNACGRFFGGDGGYRTPVR